MDTYDRAVIVFLLVVACVTGTCIYSRHLHHVERMAQLAATTHEHALLFAPGEPHAITLDATLPIG